MDASTRLLSLALNRCVKQRAEQGVSSPSWLPLYVSAHLSQAQLHRTYYLYSDSVDIGAELIRENLEEETHFPHEVQRFDATLRNMLASCSCDKRRKKSLYLAFPVGDTEAQLGPYLNLPLSTAYTHSHLNKSSISYANGQLGISARPRYLRAILRHV